MTRYVSSPRIAQPEYAQSGQSMPHLIALSVFAGLMSRVPPLRTISSIAMCSSTRRCRKPAAVSTGFCGTRSERTTAAARCRDSSRADHAAPEARSAPASSPERIASRTENGIHDGLRAGVLMVARRRRSVNLGVRSDNVTPFADQSFASAGLCTGTTAGTSQRNGQRCDRRRGSVRGAQPYRGRGRWFGPARPLRSRARDAGSHVGGSGRGDVVEVRRP